MVRKKGKTYKNVAPSPLKDGKLPKIIGGRCEYSGGLWNESDECPWFDGLHYDEDGKRRDDAYTGDLNAIYEKAIKAGKIVLKGTKKKAEAPIEDPASEELSPVVEKVETPDVTPKKK